MPQRAQATPPIGLKGRATVARGNALGKIRPRRQRPEGARQTAGLPQSLSTGGRGYLHPPSSVKSPAMPIKQWTAVDTYFEGLFIGDDPVLEAALADSEAGELR